MSTFTVPMRSVTSAGPSRASASTEATPAPPWRHAVYSKLPPRVAPERNWRRVEEGNCMLADSIHRSKNQPAPIGGVFRRRWDSGPEFAEESQSKDTLF